MLINSLSSSNLRLSVVYFVWAYCYDREQEVKKRKWDLTHRIRIQMCLAF